MLDNTFNKKESPLVGMMGGGPGGPLGISGGSTADPTYVDDVFSTYVYDGTGSSQTITNGIDLSGKGGLVWIKRRDSSANHRLGDTERGNTKYLISNQDIAETSSTNIITSFNNNGFTLGTHSQVNGASLEYTNWTFRKAPGFFDVVTYAGTGSAHSISHSLGSVPGMIIYKAIDDTREWMVYHRSLGASQAVALNLTNAAFSTSDFGSGPTSTQFSVGSGAVNNTSGKNYIAYLFAHDDQSFGTDQDEAIIKCGSYTGNGSTTGPVIDLGFEPQFLLHKRTDNADNWIVVDTMRGFTVKEGKTMELAPNTSGAENNPTGYFNITSNGFSLHTTNSKYNANGEEYIYMAIRRPNKPPEAGTDVFSVDDSQINNLAPYYKTSGHVSDFAIQTRPAQSGETRFISRITGNEYLEPATQAARQTNNYYVWDYMNGMNSFTHSDDSYGYDHYSFKRAPGFFDVVAYTGNSGSNRQITHNLESAPEMMIIKLRSQSNSWIVYHKSAGATHFLLLNTNDTPFDDVVAFNDTDPTASVFTVGDGFGVNANNQTLIAYLFASLSGISKVGSYTGTGSNVDVDCGFAAGARFVLIKRTDSSGDWYVWDTNRGIVSGNDPYLLLNSTAAEVTNTDYIDPLNAGFTVTSSAPNALNANGGTYIFLAIA